MQTNYNNDDLLWIYNEGTDDFKKITPKDNFILLMKRKKEVLGDFLNSELLASNVVNSNVVMLTYRSTYKNYSLIEEFKFIRKNKDDDLKLGTYFIDDGGKRGEVIRQ
ncbi:sugar tyrosine-protein kinase [Salmonella enterica]|nr:sugar tyrosine-protein kinase [Salmonella enterica]ECC9458860.1 sugar tyrosine-protein kinase [Salmonella enterica subsp. salamae]HAC6541043.1 sugar tyrosine-protein kinase [Salmonella enterica subsp. salamae serovar 48:d:z6]EAP4933607.1 sugar tyrosine-protein kinase [Salmonella enterica]EAP9950771.1 sugar tyrosine-protein kinase [Salmonella enterica]